MSLSTLRLTPASQGFFSLRKGEPLLPPWILRVPLRVYRAHRARNWMRRNPWEFNSSLADNEKTESQPLAAIFPFTVLRNKLKSELTGMRENLLVTLGQTFPISPRSLRGLAMFDFGFLPRKTREGSPRRPIPEVHYRNPIRGWACRRLRRRTDRQRRYNADTTVWRIQGMRATRQEPKKLKNERKDIAANCEKTVPLDITGAPLYSTKFKFATVWTAASHKALLTSLLHLCPESRKRPEPMQRVPLWPRNYLPSFRQRGNQGKTLWWSGKRGRLDFGFCHYAPRNN